MPRTHLRFSTDSDLLLFEPNLEQVWPRTNADGSFLRSWDVQHQLAMDEIERRFRNHRDTPDVFDIGRIGLRSRDNLRDLAAVLALHYIYIAADTQGDPTGYFARKSEHYYRRAHEIFQAELSGIDYDSSNDDQTSSAEQQQFFPSRVIRG